MSDSELSEEQLELVAQRFRILSDPMRLRILHALRAGEQTVTALVEQLGASQPNISKHLSLLRGVGLVKRRRAGNLAYFSIGAPFVFELCDIVCDGVRDELDRKQTAFQARP